MKIKDKIIGNDSKTFIIAEIGVNHNGDIEIAKRMINEAANSGVDAVKFQIFKTSNLMVKNTPKADYQKTNSKPTESFNEMIKKLEFSFEQFKELKSYSESKGIIFLATPFCFESADYLYKLNVDAIKISSGDIANFPFFEYLIKFKKPIIISTGTASLNEVIEVVNYFKENKFQDLAILQCTTSYPTPTINLNLRVIETYRKLFPNFIIGFSDHSTSLIMGGIAVALGARILEKHFTLDKNFEGPDHKASLEPDELKIYVNNVRETEIALGTGNKIVENIELNTKMIARKSIVSKVRIEKGTIIKKEDITIKRPGTGIPPKFYKNIIGKKTLKTIEENKTIFWEDLE